MDLRDVKDIVNEEGLVGYICPIHRHVNVRSDDFDEESITLLVVNKDGHVKEDDGILLDTGGVVIAKTPDELRAWLAAKVAG